MSSAVSSTDEKLAPVAFPQEELWMYIDDDGKPQGPFPTLNMISWFRAGYFTENTKARRVADPEFVQIGPVGEAFFAPVTATPQPAPVPPVVVAAVPDPAPVPSASTSAAMEATSAPPAVPEPVAAADEISPAAAAVATPANAADNLEEYWCYIDDEDNLQGPFEAKSMREWCEAGFFEPSTKIKRVTKATVASSLDTATFHEIGAAGVDAFKTSTAGSRPSGAAPSPSAPVHADVTAAASPSTPSSTAAASLSASVSHTPPTAPNPPRTVSGPLAEEWHYIDLHGVTQGPFSTSMMKAWVTAGFFTMKTMVRQVGAAEFIAIEESLLVSKPETVADTSASPQSGKSNGVGAVSKADLADGVTWFYLDEHRAVQGPWSTESMRNWYKAGFLQLSLLVRASHEAKYASLRDRPRPFMSESPGADGATDEAKTTESRGTPAAAAAGAATPTAAASTPTSGSSGAAGGTASTPASDDGRPKSKLWIYMGQDGQQHGPWATDLMRSWFFTGYLPPQVLVKETTDTEFKPVGSRPWEFTQPAPGAPLPGLPGLPAPAGGSVAPYAPAPWGMRQPPPYGMPGQSTPPISPHGGPGGVPPGPFRGMPPGPGAPFQQTPPGGGVGGPAAAGSMPHMHPQRQMQMQQPQPGMHPMGYPPAPMPHLAYPYGAGAKRGLESDMYVGPSGQPYGGPNEQYGDYTVAAAFNARSGRVVAADSFQDHWSSKGLPADRAGRQMNMYFDHDAWQQQKNEQLAKKRKVA